MLVLLGYLNDMEAEQSKKTDTNPYFREVSLGSVGFIFLITL